MPITQITPNPHEYLLYNWHNGSNRFLTIESKNEIYFEYEFERITQHRHYFRR